MPNTPGTGGQSVVVPLTNTIAKSVRIRITSNHGGGRVGLGEVHFAGNPIVLDLLDSPSNNLSLHNLYPNPSFDFIHVSNIKENVIVKIFNVAGKELRKVELSNS